MPEVMHTPAYMRLLDPDALTKLGRLELIARGVVEGFVAGRHRSPYRGFSVEFAEHREYVPGDNPRDLDWRVYAKSDRYYIKRYIEETNLRSVILLDASGSMSYTGEGAARRGGRRLSKFEYGQYLAATLAHLMIHQQDAVGLVTFDTEVRRYIPSRSRTSHLRVLLEELDGTEPGDETALAPIFHHIAERAHRRGLIRRSRGHTQRPPPLPLSQARGDRVPRDGGGGSEVPVRAVELFPRPGAAWAPRAARPALDPGGLPR
jgi:uncharacterized protein (DUF58 family)